jgi:formate/nitrite transporter FocA (FNT family)
VEFLKNKIRSLASLIISNVLACILLAGAIKTKAGYEKIIYTILLISLVLASVLIGYATWTDYENS